MTHEDIENRVFEETGYTLAELRGHSCLHEVSEARKRFIYLMRTAGHTDRYISLLLNRSRVIVNRHYNEISSRLRMFGTDKNVNFVKKMI
jgi:hypothetical protein